MMDANCMTMGKWFMPLCVLPMATALGCLSSNVPDRADMAKEDESLMVVRIAEIEVLPEYLDPYLAAAGNVGAESVAKEPGVVCIFPMQRKDNPCLIRIVEIYRSEEAYKAHLATPHFRAYKEGTPHMIKSLELVPMRLIDAEHMNLIFKKEQKNTNSCSLLRSLRSLRLKQQTSV